MYTDFYKLETKPFQISSDPKFLWMGEKHKEALATLKYGVLDNKGFLLLTGDVGTGKTTLIHSLIESLSEDVIFASVPDPSLTKLDFLNYIAHEFGIHEEFISKGAFLVGFRQFLIKAHEQGKKVLLIIDEAQLLTQELLEEIRLLSNIEKTHVKLINIFFVGQIEFNESLNTPQNRAVRQRLTLNYNIDPLSPDETGEYIKHRLSVAGSDEEIFEPEALREIYIYSGGFPRRINIICDHALLSGYVQDKETIDVETIRECARDLKIPGQGRPSGPERFEQYHSYNQPPAPAASMQQSRQVIIQPAQQKKPKSRFPKNLLIGAAGLLLIALIVGYLFFAGYFNGVADSGGGYPANEVKAKIVSVFSGGEHQGQKMPEQRIDNPQEKENLLSEKKIINQPEPAEEPPPPQPITEPDNEEEPLITEQEKKSAPSPTISTVDKPPISPETDISKAEIEDTEKKPEPTLPEPLPTEKIMVRFKYNTNEFTDQGLEAITRFADILSQHPENRVKITGYSDSAGNIRYNERLSEFRANIVKGFLLGRGAKTDQFEVYGRGAADPIASNETAWGRMMNRRVEIEIIK